MDLELVLSFLGASVLLTLMPGPDNIFVLTESLTKGSRNGVAVSLGLSLGVLIHTSAAAAGLSIIIQQSAIAFSIIKYLGACYLFYLAFKAVREKKMDFNVGTISESGRVRASALIKTGFLMNILNPKVALFFIAFLPQFISKNGLNITLQMILLGVIFMLQTLLIFCSIAFLSGKLTAYLNNRKFWKITKWSKVGVLMGLGMTLLLSRK